MIVEENKSKIVFCERNKYQKLHDHICVTQLEQKYGGLLSNFDKVWPPNIGKNNAENVVNLKKEKKEKRIKYVKNFAISFDYRWIMRSIFYFNR